MAAAGARQAARLAGTLALALAAALGCAALHTPIPWMLGPLLAVTLASLAGAPTAASVLLRALAQAVLGVSLGLYFTPPVLQLLATLGGAIAAAVAWALLIGTLFGAWLRRRQAGAFPGLSPAAMRCTSYYAGAVGAASEMTLQAERVGARADLVAAAHGLRMLIVVVVIPFAMLATRSLWGESAAAAVGGLPPLRPVGAAGLALLALAAAGGALAARALRLTNPWFLGPLAVAIALAATERAPSGVPTALSNAAQLLIGVSLGVRFSPGFLRVAPGWMAHVALGTLAMILASALFGAGLGALCGVPLATAVLGTAPGGMAEMAITAKVLQLGVPLVTAFQVSRMVAVLVLVQPLYRLLYGRGPVGGTPDDEAAPPSSGLPPR
ncbi:AbrB family transcriptional regulator [Piscinibacter sakaiensis]|uniref:Ammonia monooxygenase n=1 Tax=Piscinibacter sakaiensis TaxID=1547922 RepID=A0A0K8P8A0_PISS1|nr:AbrB family transcriptional regulator [Piscinibacter sakaiensis]GAP38883.1 ammonia monooxygenase [Piscinibacter sakaiensis]